MTVNEERHTPGPWKAVEAAYNPPGWLWVQNGPGALLANVHQNVNIPLDARNANARLIAAAPDLLVAARLAVLVLGRYVAHEPVEMCSMAEVADVVRAACAQAKGKP